MQKRGPILTLAIVALIAVGLLTANALVGDTEDTASETNATSAAAAATSTTATDKPPAEFQFPAEADYAGETGAIAISITVTGKEAVAYACDGNSVEAWLRGPAVDGKLDLKNDAGDTLTGTLSDTTVNGAMKIGDRSWDISAKQVQPPGGSYRYEEDGSRYSWAVQGPGDSTGVQLLPDGSTRPAPPLNDDGSVVINGRTVQAQKVTA